MSENIEDRKRTVIRRFGPKRTNGAAEGGNIAADGRRLILPESGDPDSYFTEFPLKEDFEDKQLEYIIAADEWDLARKIGEELVALKRPDLKGVRLGYLWKQKGGLRAGKAILGKAIKINPLLKTFSDRRGFVVLSADHVQGFKLTRWQVEALIYDSRQIRLRESFVRCAQVRRPESVFFHFGREGLDVVPDAIEHALDADKMQQLVIR